MQDDIKIGIDVFIKSHNGLTHCNNVIISPICVASADPVIH